MQQPDIPIPALFGEVKRRDEAYGRMIEATQAGDDVAYRRARLDFWRLGK